jgi:hypothetical protein
MDYDIKIDVTRKGRWGVVGWVLRGWSYGGTEVL